MDRLTTAVREHPWPGKWKTWLDEHHQLLEMDKRAFYAARKAFLKAHTGEKSADGSLVGRRNTTAAMFRQIEQLGHRIDDEGHLEIQTAYYKTRNRRLQARTVWPSEVSSHADPEPPPFVPPARPGLYAPISASTSPRGRWFMVRASGLESKYADLGFTDDFGGDRRPLVGVDTSSSMNQILAAVLGWREAERMVATSHFKDAIVHGLRAVAARNDNTFQLPAGAKHWQLRNAAGVLATLPYGANLSAMIRELNKLPMEYGDGWADSQNLQQLLDHGPAHDEAIKLLARVKNDYLPVCRALADAAVRRDPYRGVVFTDVFDGATVRWHAPRRNRITLSNAQTPLLINAPPAFVMRPATTPSP